MGHANDIASLADDAVAQLKDDLQALTSALRKHLQELLRAAAVDGEGRLLETAANVELAAKLEADFGRIITELGYDASVEKVLTSFEEVMARNDVHLLEQLGASLSSGNRESLGAFVNGVVDELVRYKGEAGRALREALLLGANTNAPLDDVLDDLARAAELKLGQAVTEVDTSIMAFHREALVTGAEEGGFDLFVYDGPDDSLIRPFCEKHVGRVYTASDLDAEDNEQGLWPTSRFLGGYRCRHSLSPVTVETAQEMAKQEGDRSIGGPEARRIVLRGGRGPNEVEFVNRLAGQVVTRQGRSSVVRRRARL